MKELTDNEVDLFVQALITSPPHGFTEYEKKQFMNWLKGPSVFLEATERKIKPVKDTKE